MPYQTESDQNMVKIIAKNLYSQMKLQGHDHKMALALASQLIELCTEELKGNNQISSLAS